jgi:hypothetical protein
MTALPRSVPPRKKRQRPEWLLKIVAAKRAAFDALSAEEKAAAAEVQRESRVRTRTRRSASLALAQRIFALYDSGYTAPEIAAITGRRPASIKQFAAARGVSISVSSSVGRRFVLFPREREGALRRLAEDYGTTPAKALDDLLTFTLDADDATVARRVLHVRKRTKDSEKADPLACRGAPAAR